MSKNLFHFQPLKSDHEDITINRDSIVELAKSQQQIIKRIHRHDDILNMQVAVTQAQSLIQAVRFKLQLYVRIVQAAAHHRLAFGLVSSSIATQTLQNIKVMSQDANLTPVITSIHHFHMVLKDQTINIIP